MIDSNESYRTIQLKDGHFDTAQHKRSLAYAEYGDPTGKPLFLPDEGHFSILVNHQAEILEMVMS